MPTTSATYAERARPVPVAWSSWSDWQWERSFRQCLAVMSWQQLLLTHYAPGSAAEQGWIVSQGFECNWMLKNWTCALTNVFLKTCILCWAGSSKFQFWFLTVYTKTSLVARLCPDPLGELKLSPNATAALGHCIWKSYLFHNHLIKRTWKLMEKKTEMSLESLWNALKRSWRNICVLYKPCLLVEVKASRLMSVNT